MIDIETGITKEVVGKKGNLNDFYRIEKDLVLEMLGKLKILITDEVRQKILTIPAESFFEFVEKNKRRERYETTVMLPANETVENITTLTTSLSTRLNSLDVNTGGVKIDRSDVPSRILGEPPIPPK
jgi:hypothetical protein